MSNFTILDLRTIARSCTGEGWDTLGTETLDTPFHELGLDSLAVLEIASKVRTEFKISVAEDEVGATMTPRAFIEFVNATVVVPDGAH